MKSKLLGERIFVGCTSAMVGGLMALLLADQVVLPLLIVILSVVGAAMGIIRSVTVTSSEVDTKAL